MLSFEIWVEASMNLQFFHLSLVLFMEAFIFLEKTKYNYLIYLINKMYHNLIL
jgi:hypothetical protein